MATHDITAYNKNNLKREVCAVVGSIADPLSNGAGGAALVSGDDYTICVIPPNAIVTSATLEVIEGATGTTATADVTVGSTVVINDADLKTVAVNGGALATRLSAGGISNLVTFTPTFTSASGGVYRVFIEYIDEASTLMYTEAQ